MLPALHFTLSLILSPGRWTLRAEETCMYKCTQTQTCLTFIGCCCDSSHMVHVCTHACTCCVLVVQIQEAAFIVVLSSGSSRTVKLTGGERPPVVQLCMSAALTIACDYFYPEQPAVQLCLSPGNYIQNLLAKLQSQTH